MGQLTITLPDELEVSVRKHVREVGYDSVSDFVRGTILKANVGHLPYWDRVLLVYLMETEQKLGMDINEEVLDALRDGYPKYYLPVDVAQHEMPEGEMAFVESVLQMYDGLQTSYSKSAEKDRKLEKDILFPGFDGNAGDGHYGYLHFLVKHNRYTYVKPLKKNEAINSHGAVTDMYQRMLVKYREFKEALSNNEHLNLDQIRSVISEQIHPENRTDEQV